MKKHNEAVRAWKPDYRYAKQYLMRPVAEMVADVDAITQGDDFNLPHDEDYILPFEASLEAFILT